MNQGLTDALYEVHVVDEEGQPWRPAGGFESLEMARVEAVHLIRDTPAHRVRVLHIVDYYAKSEPV